MGFLLKVHLNKRVPIMLFMIFCYWLHNWLFCGKKVRHTLRTEVRIRANPVREKSSRSAAYKWKLSNSPNIKKDHVSNKCNWWVALYFDECSCSSWNKKKLPMHNQNDTVKWVVGWTFWINEKLDGYLEQIGEIACPHMRPPNLCQFFLYGR